MEKDIDRISKNPDTDIVIRIDDFGGFRGVTIREFVKSERYTGFTKSGTRIPADKFKQFKEAINSIDEADLEAPAEGAEEGAGGDESGGDGSSGESEGEKPGEEESGEKKEDEDSSGGDSGGDGSGKAAEIEEQVM